MTSVRRTSPSDRWTLRGEEANFASFLWQGNGFQTLLELATATVEDESVDEFVIDVKRTLYWALVVHAARDSLLASNTSKGTQTNLEDETEERNQMKNKNQVEKGGKINDRQDQEDMSNGARKRVRLN